ncbi:MAG: hypothetical protein COA43_10420 [Robiginitomaculum sp.]|nr:MAG: hypothetical protein COA43_10420 [Robiginitomaculum sp.]
MELTENNIDKLLTAITDTKVFGSSKRQHQLLKYLLEETGAGRGKTIKAYSIAVDVLERDESFDNAIDSIVRVEMHRLRKNITHFNMLQNKFKIILPKASFIPKVKEKGVKVKPQISKTTPPTVVTKPLLLRHKILAVVSLIVICLTGTFTYQKYNTPANITFSARILFPTKNSESPPYQDLTIMNLTKEIKYILIHHAFVTIKNSGAHDYRFVIEIGDPNDQGAKTATILLYTKKGTLAWSSNYNIVSETDPKNIKLIAKRIFDDAFFNDGKVTHFHANNLDVNAKRRKIYQCFIDANSFSLPNIPNYRGKNPLNCLDPKLTNIRRDKNLIHVARANLYLNSLSGNFPIKIENPLQKADAELKRAQHNEFSSAEYLFTKLHVERYKTPQDNKKVKAILNELQQQYPNYQNAQFIQAYTYAELFADWGKVLPLANELLKNKNTTLSHANIFYVYHYISRNEWENAYVSFTKTPPSTAPMKTAFEAILFCNLRSQDETSDLKQSLKTFKISTPADFTHYIKKRRMHKSIEDNLLKPEIFTSCPLFQNNG